MSLPSEWPIDVRQVKFYGPFDLHHLLAGMKKFLDDKGYEFKETFKMKKGGDGWKFETDWGANIKATDFVKKSIDVYFLIMEIRDIEVVVDGKKVKMQHGRGIIEIQGGVEFDWQKKWSKPLLGFYLTYIYREQVFGKWLDNHEYEVEAFAQRVRQLLNFEVK